MTSSLLRLALLVLLAALPLCAGAAETSYRVVYSGGTLEKVPLGTGVRLYLDGTLLRLVDAQMDALAIPVTAITSVTPVPDGGRTLASRVSLWHGRRRTIAITWSYETQRGGVALQCSFAEYEGILAGLRGVAMPGTDARR